MSNTSPDDRELTIADIELEVEWIKESLEDAIERGYPYFDERQTDWICTLRVEDRRMTFLFTVYEPYWNEEPRIADVLYCLASDAASIENTKDYEDWCDYCNYDTDPSLAGQTYRTITAQTQDMRRVFGDQLYRLLLTEHGYKITIGY